MRFITVSHETRTVEVLDTRHYPTRHPNVNLMASYTTMLFWPSRSPPQLLNYFLLSVKGDIRQGLTRQTSVAGLLWSYLLAATLMFLMSYIARSAL